MANAKIDNNRKVTLMAVTDDANLTPTNLIVDPTSKRLKVSATISGGLFQYDATVGATGADYTTVASAVADGKVSLLIIANTTETADTTLTASTFIYIKVGKTLAMGTKSFFDSGAVTLTIVGEGTLSYAHTSSNLELCDGSAGSVLVIDGITITNTSTQNGCSLSTLKEIISNVTFNLPDKVNCGIELVGANYSTYSKIHFVGGGTSCEQAFLANGTAIYQAEDILFTGTFVTGDKSGSNNIAEFGGNSTHNGIATDTTAAADILFNGFDCASDINGISSALNVIIGGSNQRLSNLDLGAGDLIVSTRDFCHVTNLVTTGLLDVSNAGATNNKFTNCRCTTAVVVAGDRNCFVNCDFLGGVSVSSGADNNGFVNCQVGADAGGGVLTITVVAGSNNTRIVGCMTDAAIVDGGTATAVAANIVY